MCSLIVLRGFHAEYPVLVAANRDEHRARRAAPPGSWHGERRRVLSPRDRVAGGTWIAINDRGRFAGITNLAAVPPVVDAPSRGHLPHLVLDHDDIDAGIAAVVDKVREHPHSGFQLVVADRTRIVVVHHAGGEIRCTDWLEPSLVVTNEHQAGQLQQLRGLDQALLGDQTVEERLAALGAVLCDAGGGGHHAVIKHGEHYGTVSSSLIAVPAKNLEQLVWRYAPGPPDVTDFRNYGNLGRRLAGQ